MNLLIKTIDNDGRLAKVPEFLTTDWSIEVADPEDHSGFASALAQADAMVSMSWPIDMPPAPRLKLLQLPGAGTDEIALDTVPPLTTVCNVFEHEIGISEYVLATMLQWVVPIQKLDATLRCGEWHGSHLTGPPHRELFGQTLGIVGYGRIGREVAKRAHAFGMQIISCSQTPRNGDGLVENIKPMSELSNMLTQSDYVLLTMPLTQETRGIIGARQLASMKSTGVIINVARGALIDEEALYAACLNRTIGGAIIDTWYHYPTTTATHCAPSDFPFQELDNVVMTPHASAWTEQIMPRRNRVIAQNLDRLAQGKALVNVVREPVSYGNLCRT